MMARKNHIESSSGSFVLTVFVIDEINIFYKNVDFYLKY